MDQYQKMYNELYDKMTQMIHELQQLQKELEKMGLESEPAEEEESRGV